jgi:hypothetical protein
MACEKGASAQELFVRSAPLAVAYRSASDRAQELQRHELDVPVDAGDADAVVADRADDPCDVRAVAVVVIRVVVVVDEVPAAPVVDIAVAVVVRAVRSAARTVLTVIDPDISGEIRMCHVEARVKDSHHDAAAAGRSPPRFLRVNVGVTRPRKAVDRLPEVVEPPLLVERGVVGRGAVVGRLDAVVPLHVAHARVGAELRRRGGEGLSADGDERGVDAAEPPLGRNNRLRQCTPLPPCGDAVLKADDELSRDRSEAGRRLAGRPLGRTGVSRSRDADAGDCQGEEGDCSKYATHE